MDITPLEIKIVRFTCGYTSDYSNVILPAAFNLWSKRVDKTVNELRAFTYLFERKFEQNPDSVTKKTNLFLNINASSEIIYNSDEISQGK